VLYVGVGVRHPLLPVVYRASRASAGRQGRRQGLRRGRGRPALSGGAVLYVGVGVRPPPLPVVYRASRASARAGRAAGRDCGGDGPPGFVRRGCAICGGRGQTSPTTCGIPCSPRIGGQAGPPPGTTAGTDSPALSGGVALYVGVGVRHSPLPVVYRDPAYRRAGRAAGRGCTGNWSRETKYASDVLCQAKFDVFSDFP
jgi:hypothetical protein